MQPYYPLMGVLVALLAGLAVGFTKGIPRGIEFAGGTSVISYVATGLPSGLSIDTTSGLISGTPLASGTFSVVVGAKNAAGESLPATLVLKIEPSITFNL